MVDSTQNAAVRVAITGAAGQIGGFLTHFVAQGNMFGPNQRVILQLIELPVAQQVLAGHGAELRDGAYPLLDDIIETTDCEVGFKDADYAILVGARPRGPGMERADLLSANAAIFRTQGEILNRVAKSTTKVVVVGNPANTNALICSKNAPNIPVRNFSALTRLDQNRAVSVMAQKAGRKVTEISNLCIWGNHSKTQYPDTFNAKLAGQPLREALPSEQEWLDSEFISKVQNRGGEIIQLMGKSSAASAANAVCDHVRDLHHGTEEGRWVSMAVTSDGNPYGVTEGLIYSFPCKITNGEWSIVEGIEISEFSRGKIDASAVELSEERTMALGE